VGEGTSRVVALGGLLLLASLLSPSDFGVVAVAAFVSNAIGTMFGLGLGSVLQSMDKSLHLDRTSLFLAALVFFTAAFTASALGAPEAAPFIRALAPSLVLARWSEIRAAMIERLLNFRPVALVNAGSAVLGALVGVTSALMDAGAWALVLQSLTTYLAAALGMTVLRGGQRRPSLTVPDLRPVWSRLRPILANSVLVFTYTNLDDAILARLSGPITLGFYTFAYRISNTPTYMVTHMVNRVMLPTYMALTASDRSWDQAFRRMVRILSFLAGILMFSILVYGPSILTAVYGDRWTSAYSALRILSIYGLLRTVGATTGPVFLASGRPSLIRKIAQWQVIVMLITLFPAVRLYGIVGASVAVTAPLAIATFVALAKVCRIVGVPWRSVFADVARLWCVAFGIILVALPIVSATPGSPGILLGAAIVVFLTASYGWFGLREDLLLLKALLRPSRQA
jgi:PST family polysaccharide transporter/lipopolysaccharide exporter